MRRTALCFALVFAAGCAPREVRVTMNSDNNSGQKGFAVITDKGDSVTVVVETNAPEFEGPQNVHIHKGNCGEVEGVYADLLNLTALEGKPGRVGSTTIDVKKRPPPGPPLESLQFEEMQEGEWLINVHDARENTLYVSCGEFTLP